MKNLFRHRDAGLSGYTAIAVFAVFYIAACALIFGT